jgi:acetoin utilization deacetylase AcuC-like enzyme
MHMVTHSDFLQAYTRDPAAAPGRIESILQAVKREAVVIEAEPAGWDDIEAVHTQRHIDSVSRQGLYNIAVLAAGATIQAAAQGFLEPSFALVRPPGHHASPGSSWGFCFFNNIAVALEHLRRAGQIGRAFVLDFDMHFGDGTVACLTSKGYAVIHNPAAQERTAYLREVADALAAAQADVLAVSAGFDNHEEDWGGILTTEDYHTLGQMVWTTARRWSAACFGVLEGGYNHQVLGESVYAFLKGFTGR